MLYTLQKPVHYSTSNNLIKPILFYIEERAAARVRGRPEKFGPKDIEMMKALIESGTPIKDVSEKGACLAQRFIVI